MGLRVVGTDVNPAAPAFALADVEVLASTRAPSETVSALLARRGEFKLDGVVTMANDVPKTVAEVAETFDLPGWTVAVAERFSNKLEMKQCFLDAGVPTPAFFAVQNPAELKRYHEDFLGSGPAVIKPIDGRGAQGVRQLGPGSSYKDEYARAREHSEANIVLLEKFIFGQQYSAESIITRDRVVTAGLAVRNYSRLEEFHPHIIEDGGDLRNDYPHDLESQASEVVRRAAESLGVDSGVVKADLVADQEGRLLVIELAGRLSGGWFASHQIPKATGINLMEVAIRISLGLDVSDNLLSKSENRAVSTRYWFPRPGEIVSIEGVDELSKKDGVIHYGTFRDVGEIQPSVQKHSDRFGFVICEGATAKQAVERVQSAIDSVSIKVEAH